MNQTNKHEKPTSSLLKYSQSLPAFWLFSFFVFFLVSCHTQRQVQYLQGNIDTAALSKVNLPELIIQKGDLLGITVYSDNALASAEFNQPNSTSTAGSISSGAMGASSIAGTANSGAAAYVVYPEGFIYFNSLGKIKVEGLTKRQVTENLNQLLTQYLKNPYCELKVLNSRFTILGEVSKQGVYNMSTDNVSIIEALGLAGDITMYGLKDSILVMRETNEKRSFGYLDVSKPEVILSPFYYLRQNDVVFVRATPKKQTAADQNTTRNLTIVATIATVITSLSLIVFNILR